MWRRLMTATTLTSGAYSARKAASDRRAWSAFADTARTQQAGQLVEVAAHRRRHARHSGVEGGPVREPFRAAHRICPSTVDGFSTEGLPGCIWASMASAARRSGRPASHRPGAPPPAGLQDTRIHLVVRSRRRAGDQIVHAAPCEFQADAPVTARIGHRRDDGFADDEDHCGFAAEHSPHPGRRGETDR